MATGFWGKDVGGTQFRTVKDFMPKIPTVQRSSSQQARLNSMKQGSSATGTYLTGKTPILSFKKGGKVPKTGIYKLHKGERVVSRKQLEKIADKTLFNK